MLRNRIIRMFAGDFIGKSDHFPLLVAATLILVATAFPSSLSASSTALTPTCRGSPEDSSRRRLSSVTSKRRSRFRKIGAWSHKLDQLLLSNEGKGSRNAWR